MSREIEILNFIRAFIAENTYPPTYQEIAEGVGVSKGAGVTRPLAALKREGLIDYEKGRYGSLRVTQ